MLWASGPCLLCFLIVLVREWLFRFPMFHDLYLFPFFIIVLLATKAAEAAAAKEIVKRHRTDRNLVHILHHVGDKALINDDRLQILARGF